jgi:MazG family protein
MASDDARDAFARLVDIMARLRAPGGCPWDREQTTESLQPYLVEEAYEVLDAIAHGDAESLRDELGDVLLQVVFHAEIATGEARFTIDDVIARVHDKMVRRHPHVFADDPASTPGEVLRNWEALKEAERAARGEASAESMLDSVPAVMEALQMTTKVARVGFDWPDAQAVLAKVDEELAELKAAPGVREAEEEIGDLLFAIVNLARHLDVDPESALKAANRKFRRRFAHVESRLRETGRKPADSTLSEMDVLWEEAKARE